MQTFYILSILISLLVAGDARRHGEFQKRHQPEHNVAAGSRRVHLAAASSDGAIRYKQGHPPNNVVYTKAERWTPTPSTLSGPVVTKGVWNPKNVQSTTLTTPTPAKTTTTSSAKTTTQRLTTTQRTTTTTTSAAPTTTSSSSGTLPSLAAAALKEHNDFRAKYGASPLVWDIKLASYAQAYSDKCVFEHSSGPYGENLSAQTGSPFTAAAVDQLIVFWENEASDYNAANPQYSHFTQMVWKSSTALGCGFTICPAGSIFDASYGPAQYLVCEYNPPGNVIGEFGSNVQ